MIEQFLNILKGRIFINQFLSRLLPQALGFLLGILIARISGLDVLGEYGSIMALLNMTYGVLAAGLLTNYLRLGDVKQYKNAVNANISLWAGLFIFLIGVGYLLKLPLTALFFFYISIVFMKLTELYIIKTRFLNKDVFSIPVKVVPYVIIILGMFLFKPKEVLQLSIIFAAGWSSFLFFFYRSRHIYQKIFSSVVASKLFLKSSIPLVGATLFTQVYANVDQLMIRYFNGDIAVGAYRIAISFSALAFPAIGVFAFIYLSQLQRLIANNQVDEKISRFKQQVLINGSIGIFFFLFCLFSNQYLIPFLYGEDAIIAVDSSIILSFGVTFNVLAMVYSYSLLAIHKEKLVLVIVGIAAILNILLNYIFIPKYGLNGAAAASVFTQFFILVLLTFYLHKKTNFFVLTKI